MATATVTQVEETQNFLSVGTVGAWATRVQFVLFVTSIRRTNRMFFIYVRHWYMQIELRSSEFGRVLIMLSRWIELVEAVAWLYFGFDCRVLNYSSNFINVEVSMVGSPPWRLTSFYGYPESGRRRDSWDLLKTLSRDNELLRCVMGDFNDILFNEEIRGQPDRQLWVIRGFQEVVQESMLVDLPMEGYRYTWTKSVKEGQLDRILVSQSSLDAFPHNFFVNGVSDKSDHTPL